MSRLRVESFSISLDGFGAGPDQSLNNPLGIGGPGLHTWAITTDTFQRMLFGASGARNVDDRFASRGFENIGAAIMGRNMFGPVRGPWPDESWKGWWGDNPPYHTPVFVLTHHPRASITMQGGTTFHFVTGGIHEALNKARQAAGGKDIRLSGGVSTVRQYLLAGLVDELHIAISPVLLGAGESLFGGINLLSLGYRCIEHAASEHATHMILRKDRPVA